MNPQTNSSQPQPSTSIVYQQPSRNYLLTIIGIIIFLILVTTGVYYLGKRQTNQQKLVVIPTQTVKITSTGIAFNQPTQTITSKPSDQNKNIISEIIRRSYINDQMNIQQPSQISFGFLDSKLLNRKRSQSLKLNFPSEDVYASESTQSAHPFLFYIKNKTQIKAFDLAEGIELELLDLRDFSNISQLPNTSIVRQTFLNKTKRIVFWLNEQKSDSDYENSLQIYDVKNQKLSEIISDKKMWGISAEWGNIFRVSPDENYLFDLIGNIYSGPFINSTSKISPSGESSKDVYIFYDLNLNKLNGFQSKQRNVAVSLQWSADSKNVYIINSRQLLSVSPGGDERILFEQPNADVEFRKAQYFSDLNKIFYISTGSRQDANSYFSGEHFGYFDLKTKKIINPIEPGYGTSQFIYDYKGNIIFNTFVRSQGAITNNHIKKINIDTDDIKEITAGKYLILSFDGDYDHLLVSQSDDQKSNIYDLTISSGEVKFINTAPAFIGYNVVD